MRLQDEAFKEISNILESGKTILELGSGVGTKILISMGYNVISIEQDKAWQGKYHSNYINCPIKKYEAYWWFDSDYLSSLPDYDFLLIDGPTGPDIREFDNCRIGILDHLNLFKLSVPILVDDINRESESLIFNKLKENRSYKNHGKFAIIY